MHSVIAADHHRRATLTVRRSRDRRASVVSASCKSLVARRPDDGADVRVIIGAESWRVIGRQVRGHVVGHVVSLYLRSGTGRLTGVRIHEIPAYFQSATPLTNP